MKGIYFIMLSFFLITTINAQGLLDGFTPKKGDLSITGSYTFSNYDEFYLGPEKSKLADAGLFGEITQNIFSLYAKYGISNRVSVILNVPFISAETDGTNDPINGLSSISDLQDISIAFKINAAKFTIKGGDLNLITGVTTHIPTGYEPNGVLSIGSGAFGVDVAAGLHLNTNIGFFSTILGSYNFREDAVNNFMPGGSYGVPNSFSTTGKLGYASSFIYVEAWAAHVNSEEGVDIGSAQFTGNLPETDVDYSSLGITVYKNILPKLGLSLGYGKIIDGRNVGASTNYSVGLTYNFNQ